LHGANVLQYKEVKTGCDLAEFPKEVYDSKNGCFANDGVDNLYQSEMICS
jgi:hypothetical protein